jgi:MATE family multidrug resistance protein
VAIWLSLAFALIAALVVYFLRSQIAGLYSTEVVVVSVAADLLIFVAMYQFFDDAQVTAVGALRGFKDTRTTMWVAMFSYWVVGLPVGVAVGFGWIELPGFEGVRGFWLGLITGLGVAAVVLAARFRWLSHRPDRVARFSER